MASNEVITSTTTNNLAQLLDHDHHRRSDSEDHDTLSFCDFMIGNDENSLPDGPVSGDFDDQEEEDRPFEFMTSSESDTENIGTDKIVFCGKTMTQGKLDVDFNENSGGDVRYPRKGLLVRRDSFKKYQSFKPDMTPSSNVLTDGYGSSQSSSFRFGKFEGPKEAIAETTGGYYRSNSGSLRKQKVFIGLVTRFEPMMELSEIRKRQGRRSPAPMFPAPGSPVEGEEKARGSCHDHPHHHWGVLRSRWCRANFMSALTKASFGCMSR